MQSWIIKGVCKGKQELFFPSRYEHAKQRAAREAKAKAICATCPVAEPCRKWGIVNELAYTDPEYFPDGIWGGMNRDELLEYAYTNRDELLEYGASLLQ